MDEQHLRPPGATDDEVEAAGKMTEALETLERARGHLFSFHQLVGSTDLSLDEVVDGLRGCGRDDLADAITEDLRGRNVIAGRWTFQLVDEFEDGYYTRFRAHEKAVRDALTAGRRHVFEAEMKEDRRTHGRRGHESTPADAPPAPDTPSDGSGSGSGSDYDEAVEESFPASDPPANSPR